MKRDVDKFVRNYISFLNKSLDNVCVLETEIKDKIFVDELKNDFYQANWEIFVESLICIPGIEFLEVYGDGADCNGASSRVCLPDKLPTHRIACVPKKGNKVKDMITGREIILQDQIFQFFVHYEDNQWQHITPINGVLCENENYESLIINIDDVVFTKIKIIDKDSI